MGGQSTSIGQQTDASNAGNAIGGFGSQNSQLNNQFNQGNPSSLLNTSTTAAETAATNSAISQASGQVASQKGLNPALAARLAGQNAAQQSQSAANSLTANAAGQSLQAQGIISGNLANINSNAQSGINQINSANASTDNGSASAVSGAIGGLAKAAGSAATMGMYTGGKVGYATGGAVPAAPIAPQFSPQDAPSMSGDDSNNYSKIGQALMGLANPQGANEDDDSNYARGGKVAGKPVKAMVSPGEISLRPKAAEAVAKGKANPLKAGEKIPGKAPVKGDSPKNDVVPKTLEAGGVVIPRSVLDSPNPHKAASKFVAAALMHHRLTKKYGK